MKAMSEAPAEKKLLASSQTRAQGMMNKNFKTFLLCAGTEM